MSIADERPHETGLYHLDYLKVVISQISGPNNSNRINNLAELFSLIVEALEEDPPDLKPVIQTLKDAVELLFLRTEEYKMALRLYWLFLMGRTFPDKALADILTPILEEAEASYNSKKNSDVSDCVKSDEEIIRHDLLTRITQSLAIVARDESPITGETLAAVLALLERVPSEQSQLTEGNAVIKWVSHNNDNSLARERISMLHALIELPLPDEQEEGGQHT